MKFSHSVYIFHLNVKQCEFMCPTVLYVLLKNNVQ